MVACQSYQIIAELWPEEWPRVNFFLFVVMKMYIHQYFNDLSTNLVATKSSRWIIETVIQNVICLREMLQITCVYWWQFLYFERIKSAFYLQVLPRIDAMQTTPLNTAVFFSNKLYKFKQKSEKESAIDFPLQSHCFCLICCFNVNLGVDFVCIELKICNVLRCSVLKYLKKTYSNYSLNKN